MGPSDAEIQARLTAGYLGAAGRDLMAAELLSKGHNPEMSSTAAYHLQQCVEKLIKAVFIARALTVTKEHRLLQNIEVLAKAKPGDPWIGRLMPLQTYDIYATTKRYPSSTGKLATGPAVDVLERDIERLRQLLAQAATELAVPPEQRKP